MDRFYGKKMSQGLGNGLLFIHGLVRVFNYNERNRMLVKLEETNDGTGDLILPLGMETCAALGWAVDDVVVWSENGDGTFTLSKKNVETELVLVETVSSFKITYVVEVPKGNKEWALDTVALEEAPELAQSYIGEQIVSHRVVDIDEVRNIARLDTPWLSDDRIKESIFPLEK
jgi:hypothetical protein